MEKDKNTDNKIVLVKIFAASETPWGKDAALLWKGPGNDRLTMRYGKCRSGVMKRFVMLDGRPLLKWRHRGDGETAAEHFLSSGKCVELHENEILNILSPEAGFEYEGAASFKKISGFLEMLETGLYILTEFDHFPADLNGRFFWDFSRENSGYRHIGHQISPMAAYPAFLYPAFSETMFCDERVKHYQKMISSGAQLTALAFYFDEYASIILDGHHRAAASFLEGVKIRCTTVVPCSGYKFVNDKTTHFCFAGMAVPVNAVHSSMIDQSSISGERYKIDHHAVSKLDAIDAGGGTSDGLMADLKSASGFFPPLNVVEGADIIGDFSDENIRAIIDGEGSEKMMLQEILFDVLDGFSDPRTFAVAKELALSERHSHLWEKAFAYLSNFKNAEVEDIFVEFIVGDDGRRPNLTKIANDYFETK